MHRDNQHSQGVANLRCLSADTEGKHPGRAHDKLSDVLRQSGLVLQRVVDEFC